MNAFRYPLTLLAALLAAATGLASAHDADATASPPASGPVERVEHAVARGAHAAASGIEHGAEKAASGIERGAKATARGVKRGVKAAARGVEHGAEATARAASHVAAKVSGSSASSAGH